MTTNFLYHRVYTALREQIASGQFAPGTKLPVERELIDAFSVSVITIKKAMNMLVDEGLVVRIPGRGTFVRETTLLSKHVGPPLIGVIMEHVASPFGLSMLYELERLIGLEKRRMIVRFSYCDRERESDEISFLLQLGVQGLIIMPSHGLNYNPDILRLVLSRFPVILVDKKLDGIDVPSVRTDNVSAMRDLVLSLSREGKRRIGLISTAECGASSTQERRIGFYQGIREAGLDEMPECILPFSAVIETSAIAEPPSQAPMEGIVTYLSACQASLDALICSEYSIIPKLISSASSMGLDIGRQMKICCIDEDYESHSGYTFTHMKQNERVIAARAVELLMARIRGDASPSEDILVPALFREAR